MREIAGDIERWRAAGEDVAIATVVASRRSAPRPIGSKLGVSSGGELAGSVSGGCVESDVYGVEQDVHELSRDIIRGGRSRVVEVEGVKLFADVFAPPPRLVVIGAVDTAEALCHAAKNLGWRTIVADPRGKFMTRERIPSADELLPVWPDEALAQVQPDYDTAIVVLTH